MSNSDVLGENGRNSFKSQNQKKYFLRTDLFLSTVNFTIIIANFFVCYLVRENAAKSTHHAVATSQYLYSQTAGILASGFSHFGDFRSFRFSLSLRAIVDCIDIASRESQNHKIMCACVVCLCILTETD